MNPFYNQIRISQFNDEYHLFAFNGDPVGAIHFKTEISEKCKEEDLTWLKVKVLLNGTPLEGYVSLKESPLESLIGSISGPPEKIAQILNDLAIRLLNISSLDQAYYEKLMHLGMSEEEFERLPELVIKSFDEKAALERAIFTIELQQLIKRSTTF